MGEEVLHPRTKVTVMIIGNHSSGKSSFVNWYVDEHVCPTGVAIESKGFTLVTYGKRPSAPIKGEGSLRYFPHIKGIRDFKGAIERIQTVTSVSNVKKFTLVDFLDTPGLVGGREKAQYGARSGVGYSFDVNNVMLYLADHVDLIFVFLDPIGQALCTRTMDVVEALNKRHYMKMKYYLTKADEVDSSADLIKVIAQVTQNLAHRVSNNHGFEVPSIFLPTNDKVSKEMAKLNNIDKLCFEIEQTIEQKVQVNLDRLRDDSKALLRKVRDAIAVEDANRESHRSMGWKQLLVGVCAWFFVPLLACLLTIGPIKHLLPVDVATHDVIRGLEMPGQVLNGLFPQTSIFTFWLYLAGLFLVLVAFRALYRCRRHRIKLRSDKERLELAHFKSTLEYALKEREKLHEELVSQTVHKD